MKQIAKGTNALMIGVVNAMSVESSACLVIVLLFVEKNAFSGPVKILVLASSHRPEEGEKAHETEKDGDRNEESEDLHQRGPFGRRPRRMALKVTSMELADMAIAAIQGVTRPAIATGTQAAL